jgi:hypothetical protein
VILKTAIACANERGQVNLGQRMESERRLFEAGQALRESPSFER